MSALFLTLFVSAVLVVGWMLMFGASIRRRDHDQSERLSLLPLEDDEVKSP